jgi:hypothetical protein
VLSSRRALRGEARHPNPHLFSIIPLLWTILDLVCADWEHEVAPRQRACDLAETTDQRIIFSCKAFADLEPSFLKCLFSYISFFVSLEHAYDLFYRGLNHLNRLPLFQVRHPKPPKRDSYIDRVHLVRDIALVHFGSNNATEADAASGLLWEPTSMSGTPEGFDLSRITFRPGRLVLRDSVGQVIGAATDLEINGLPELDQHCTLFLHQYDTACADYLRALQARLPRDSAGFRYQVLGKPWHQ